MSANLFRPILGTNEKILNCPYQDGSLYFATDSKKIYLDANDQNKLSMGGNSSIFYGALEIGDSANEGQTEFNFTLNDLEPDNYGNLLIPNRNDLILNIPDGCFYRVNSIKEENDSVIIIAEKLTIAGSNNSSVGNAKIEFNFITPQQGLTLLYKKEYDLQLGVTVKNYDDVLITDQGSYELIINGRTIVQNGVLKQDSINSIPIHNYLDVGPNTIIVRATVNIGNGAFDTRNLSYLITTTQASLIWDYEKDLLNYGNPNRTKTINYLNNDFVLDYNVTGSAGTKHATLLVDEILSIDLGKFTGNAKPFIFTPELLQSYNIAHGIHKFTLSASIDLNGTITPLGTINKNILFVDPEDVTPIISCDFFENKILQYNTVFIPISIYSSTNINNSAIIDLFVDGEPAGSWTEVVNRVVYDWTYTPVTSGYHTLTVQYNDAQVNLNVEVEALDLGKDGEEVPDYVFKLKASDFANQEAIQKWESNGVTLTPSDNFDWINGGFDFEQDENGNNRSFIKIKAGSSIDINYQLFKNFTFGKGRTFKIIFKTDNCKDYDATILKCSKYRKLLQYGSEKLYLPIENGTTVFYSEFVDIESELLQNEELIVYDREDEVCRTVLENKYILFNDKIYICHFEQEENDEGEKIWIGYWFDVNFIDGFDGFEMQAQSATLRSFDSVISTQYCEDTYIEFEFDISARDNVNKIKNYIKFWIDGVPAGYVVYPETDSFNLLDDVITIGSQDCDVSLYMIKVYDKGLSDDEHLRNFIADAPNAEEMLNRFRRNDIKDDERNNEISYTKLAKANPDCYVHLYDIPKMTKRKKDPVYGCVYDQYKGSDISTLHAEGVTIKVQGTSSEYYVPAAANLDTNFNDTDSPYTPTGFINPVTGEKYEGWSMDGGDAIACDFFCTKVNVASCEHANNALNQEWYNLFQPYQSVLKCKNPKTRDTMQFTNGVIFIKDRNPEFNINASDVKENNIFGEIVSDGISYLSDPYYKMYSIGQMGNSKNNIHVFHDLTNPKECCVEVRDNQSPQQWMVSYDFSDDIDKDDKKYFEFRYIHDEAPVTELQQGWKRLVTWMATSNPSPKYKAHVEVISLDENNFESNKYFIKTKNGHYEKALEFDNTEIYYKSLVSNQSEFNQIAKNWKTMKDLPVFVLNDEKTAYNLVEAYNENYNIYFTETEHIYGSDNLKLPQPEYIEAKTFNGFKTDLIDPQTNELYQKDYNPVIAGIVEDTYEGTYEYNTYEYKMAKMLKDCEKYLIMDSIVYHYLFIERHCMIDNVAKNTFWSTEDGQHWNLIKDYDNDTSDGNDNNGKFTRNYGMEPLDKLNDTTYVFNAHQSVWLNFIHGLTKTKQEMFQRLEAKEKIYQGKSVNVWSKDDYLWLFEKWQSIIPERCWIEDYYRKYIRLYELYNIKMFNGMMEGGQKKHQRKQYETYQDTYMSSEYFGEQCSSSYAWFRPTGDGLLNYKIPTQVYSDCYIYADVGQQRSRHRAKRNEWNAFTIPQDNLGNATMNLHPMKVISILGQKGSEDNKGLLGALHPDVFDTQKNAGKLRELVFSTKDDNLTNNLFKEGLGLGATELLEKLYIADFAVYTQGLDLKDCINLRELDATNSTFTSIILPDNAPLEVILLHMPSSVKMSNLFNVSTFNISNYSKLTTLDLNNIDYGAIKTKELVEKALAFKALKRYSLLNIKWLLSEDNEIDIVNNTIPILEKLLAINTIEDNEGPRPKSASLSGTITIPETVYNGSKSFEIYSKYAAPDIYPNLDINFEGSNAKLFNIKIYDGDNKVRWYKKIVQNGTIDEEFLKTGPSGAFDTDILYKSPTAESIYTFTNKWKIYKNEDLSDTPEEFDGELPLINMVNSDIILVPQFESSFRPYTLTFYDDNREQYFIQLKNIRYGTTWAEINQQLNKIPYKEAPEDLRKAWNFEGYSLLPDSTNLVSDNYRVIRDQSFFAVFKMIEDISTIVHPEWFDFKEYTFSHSEISHQDVQGYQAIPKYTLKGKITIPKEYNNKPVISLDLNSKRAKNANGNMTYGDPSEITHIFFENESNILEIVDSTTGNDYGDNTDGLLKYCDLPESLIYLGNNVFMRCPYFKLPENDNGDFILPDKLQYIGKYCFWFAGQSNISEQNKLYVPSSIEGIGYQGLGSFGNPNVPLTIVIGSAEKYSNLNFNIPDLTKISSVDNNETSYEFKKFYSSGKVAFEWYLSRYTDLLLDSKIVPASTEGYKEDAWYVDYTIADVWDGPITGLSLNNKLYPDIS